MVITVSLTEAVTVICHTTLKASNVYCLSFMIKLTEFES